MEIKETNIFTIASYSNFFFINSIAYWSL